MSIEDEVAAAERGAHRRKAMKAFDEAYAAMSVTVALSAGDKALLTTISTRAGLPPDDAVRVALWKFGRFLGIDVPPSAFAVRSGAHRRQPVPRRVAR